MEQYAQMRNSGVPWIQSIPETWGIRVLFQLADQVKNKNKDLLEKNLLSLSYGRIKRKDINNPEGLLPESFDGYNIHNGISIQSYRFNINVNSSLHQYFLFIPNQTQSLQLISPWFYGLTVFPMVLQRRKASVEMLSMSALSGC